MRTFTVAAVATLSAIVMSEISMGRAAEIKVISANGMREVIAETKTKFEATSGHKLAVTIVETGEIRRRVLAGETFDVILVPRAASDEFEKQGNLLRPRHM